MLRTRIITTLVALALIGIVLFVLPARLAEAIIGVLLVGGAWEWSGFLQQSSPAWRAIYTAVIAALLAAVWAGLPAGAGPVLQLALVFWALAFIAAFRFPMRLPPAVRWLAGALVLVPLYAALLILLRLGVGYLLFVLLIVWAADAGAYFAGKRFGRVKLAPSISPGKTWEGVIGGMSLVAVLALATGVWQQLHLAVFVPFCLAVAALSVVGDLTVSMFKRTAGVKDSGTLFPGHGGILDRVDSVAAAAPLFALGISWLGLV